MQESTCLFHHLLSLAFLFLSNPSLTLCVLLQPVTPPSSYNAKPPNPTTTHGTQRGADCVSEAGRPNVRTSRSVLTNTPGNRLHSLFAISSPQNLQPFHPFRIFKPSRWRELFTISLVRPFMLFWPSYMVVFLYYDRSPTLQHTVSLTNITMIFTDICHESTGIGTSFPVSSIPS